MLRLPQQAILERLAVGGEGRADRQRCLENVHHRAAVSLRLWRGVNFSEEQVPCTQCARLTSAYCEGCLWRGKRHGEANTTPFALCSQCDDEARVCGACRAEGISHEEAAALYQRTFPLSSRAQALLVFGVRRDDGTFERLEEPKEVPLSFARDFERPSSAAGSSGGRSSR